MTRIWRAPWVHFLALGGALVLWQRSAPPPAEIRIDAGDLARTRRAWIAVHGTTPDDATLAAHAADDEILHREALAHALDRTQPVVRARLAGLTRFLQQPVEDEDALVEAAQALGLDRSDIVVRRHLVQTMRLALGRLDDGDLPDEVTIAAWYARQGDRFAEPPRVRLTQVYLRRDEDVAAAALLARVRRDGVAPDVAAALGRPFPQGATHGPLSFDALARVFGDAFAAAVAALPSGAWAGPVPSAYGLHLVWVHERLPARVPALADVRGRVVQAMLAERRAERVQQRLATLRARYAVRIDSGS